MGNSLTFLTVWFCPPVFGCLRVGAGKRDSETDSRLGVARLQKEKGKGARGLGVRRLTRDGVRGGSAARNDERGWRQRPET